MYDRKLSTALIQRGTLKKGCVLVAGTAWAKVTVIVIVTVIVSVVITVSIHIYKVPVEKRSSFKRCF